MKEKEKHGLITIALIILTIILFAINKIFLSVLCLFIAIGYGTTKGLKEELKK